MELIVELVSRSKKLIQRHKIQGNEIAIGRGYDNDVVLADPYVCPHHLMLKATDDGIWQVCDRDSVNGSFTDTHKRLTDCQAINSGDVVSVGKSHLRFIYPNQAIAPTIRLSGIEGLLNFISSGLVVAMVFLIYVSLLLGDHYLQSVTELKTSVMLKTIFSLLVVSSLWPMLCGLLARLFKNDARILTQMALCYSFFILFLLFSWINEIISFNTSTSWLSSSFSFITEAALLFALLWANFYVAFHQSQVRRTMMASSFTLVILLLSFLYNNSANRDFNPQPSYNSTLLTPEFALSTPVSIPEFIATSEGIFDSTAAKALSKKDN